MSFLWARISHVVLRNGAGTEKGARLLVLTGSNWLGSSGLRRQKAGSSGRNTELSGNWVTLAWLFRTAKTEGWLLRQ
jgi:hypothetical protein